MQSRRAVVAVVTATLLTACSGGGQAAPGPGDDASAPPPAAPTVAAPPAVAPPADPSAPEPLGGPDGAATSASPVVPVAVPASLVPVDQVIRDPDLGHEIRVLRLARDLPWPQAQADEAGSLELVGVEMTWTPGTTYTATLRTVDFSLGTSSTFPNRPDALLNPGLQAAGWSVLPAEMAHGQTGTGWLVFRVEPKGATALRLDYTRPPSRVTDSGQTFPKTVFSAQLVG